MTKPSVIIFDFDETLINVFQDENWFKVLRKRIIEYYSKYVDTSVYLQEKYDVLDYEPYYELIEKIHEIYPDTEADKINKSAFDIVESFEKEVLDTVSFFEDVASVIPALYSQGIKLGIASNNGVEPIKYALRNVCLDKYFSAVAGRAYPYHRIHEKPRANYLYNAMNEIGVKDNDIIWYVGDRITDIQASVSAGVIPISVATGKISAEDLQSNGAERVFDSLTHLYEYLQTKND